MTVKSFLHRLIAAAGLRAFDVYLAATVRAGVRIYSGPHRSYGFTIRAGTSDRFVVDEVWRTKVYGPPPSGTVVDIGANIGAYTIFASQTADRVIAVEPVPTNVAQLRSNLARNSITNVEIEEAAVSAAGDEQTIWVNRNNAGACSAYGATGTPIVSRALRFDDLLRAHGITVVDVVKIDIEGMEYGLLTDPDCTLLTCAKRIVVEFHSGWGFGGTPAEGVAALRGAGYTVTAKQPWRAWLAGTGVWHADRT